MPLLLRASDFEANAVESPWPGAFFCHALEGTAMNLAAVAAPYEPIAFPAYYSLVSPALRDVARGPLRRARHGGRPCSGVDGTRWCDECEQTVHDHLLAGYTRLRGALAGVPRRTRTGDRVREMDVIVAWLTSPEAARVGLGPMARLIRRGPGDGEPAGVRAARAQLVHHLLRSLEPRVRREDAMSRGGSAKPERDLRKSDWARPLRADAVAFELLVDAVVRLRHGARDLYDIPAARLAGLGVDQRAGRRSLRDALDRLRTLRPGFHAANVAVQLGPEEFSAEPFPELSRNPEELILLGEETDAARRALSLLVDGEDTAGGHARHRALLARICAADLTMSGGDDGCHGGGDGDGSGGHCREGDGGYGASGYGDGGGDGGLVGWTAREFGLGPTAAGELIRRLVRLAFQAGLDWCADRCRTVG
mgnify:FL=1